MEGEQTSLLAVAHPWTIWAKHQLACMHAHCSSLYQHAFGPFNALKIVLRMVFRMVLNPITCVVLCACPRKLVAKLAR